VDGARAAYQQAIYSGHTDDAPPGSLQPEAPDWPVG
jgi:hypothetical protein